jgi:hypothetical protein
MQGCQPCCCPRLPCGGCVNALLPRSADEAARNLSPATEKDCIAAILHVALDFCRDIIPAAGKQDASTHNNHVTRQ